MTSNNNLVLLHKGIPMSQRIKLTTRGKAHEWKRFHCPQCEKTLLIHPDRWLVHLQECIGPLLYERKLFLLTKEKEEETKSILAELLLQEAQSDIKH